MIIALQLYQCQGILKSPKLKYLCTFREGKKGRKREKHQGVVASSTPPAGDLARNPNMCPRLGIKPGTLWFEGWQSVHWVTPAMARKEDIKKKLKSTLAICSYIHRNKVWSIQSLYLHATDYNNNYNKKSAYEGCYLLHRLVTQPKQLCPISTYFV